MFIDEDNNIELKEILSSSLAKEIVAFLNTDGGIIYLGIKNNREVIGMNNIDENMRKISCHNRSNFTKMCFICESTSRNT